MARSYSRKKKAPLLPEGFKIGVVNLLVMASGILIIAISALMLISLFTYSSGDPSFNTANAHTPSNWLGLPGAYLADFLIQGLGVASAFLILVVFEWGYKIMMTRQLSQFLPRLILLPLMLACAAAFFAVLPVPSWWPLNNSLGGFGGSFILSGFASLVPFGQAYVTWAVALALLGVSVALYIYVSATTRQDLSDFTQSVMTTLLLATAVTLKTLKTLLAMLYRSGQYLWARLRKQPEEVVLTKRKTPKADLVKKKKSPKKSKKVGAPKQTKLSFVEDDFILPGTDLLQDAPPATGEVLSKEALEQNARFLESVLGDFGVQGEITKVRPGPVVTLYELEPAAGVKSSRVIGLADDIARSMSAVSVRVAVVPGKNVIGIELPNTERETVYLRELLESKDYADTNSSLPLVLGKDIGGTPVITDLSRMPHLLIAGTTGSGKSVAINTMILSLLYRLPPDQCRIILIDPKMLELSVYDGIPHLLSPVVTDPKKAVVALKWCVREMEDRYRAMSKLGVRNIASYNSRLKQAQAKGEVLNRRVQTGFDEETGKPVFEDQPLELKELPYIVVVVDEMADLMLVAGKDIEAAIQRLAQMARAAGIHLIMATQRPSVDVITGTIKANFPTRVSFQVTSKIDSRTILGEQGAEQLLGQGDMLYMAGGGRLMRVHGPFVSDKEVEKVVRHLSNQGEPEYLDSVTEEDEDADPLLGFEGSTGGNTSEEDALYDQAIQIILRDKKVSISYIQRRLRIGYNKAASLIERMEDDGIITPANNAGKREILARRADG